MLFSKMVGDLIVRMFLSASSPSYFGPQWFPTPGIFDSSPTIFTTDLWKLMVLTVFTLLHQIS